MSCIQIFPYERADKWTKKFAYANLDEEEQEMFGFDDWDYEMLGRWFAVTPKGWALEESIEEAIIEAFDMLDIPFDEADLDRLYGEEGF